MSQFGAGFQPEGGVVDVVIRRRGSDGGRREEMHCGSWSRTELMDSCGEEKSTLNPRSQRKVPDEERAACGAKE